MTISSLKAPQGHIDLVRQIFPHFAELNSQTLGNKTFQRYSAEGLSPNFGRVHESEGSLNSTTGLVLCFDSDTSPIVKKS